jgi:hypothetical protein
MKFDGEVQKRVKWQYLCLSMDFCFPFILQTVTCFMCGSTATRTPLYVVHVNLNIPDLNYEALGCENPPPVQRTGQRSGIYDRRKHFVLKLTLLRSGINWAKHMTSLAQRFDCDVIGNPFHDVHRHERCARNENEPPPAPSKLYWAR